MKQWWEDFLCRCCKGKLGTHQRSLSKHHKHILIRGACICLHCTMVKLSKRDNFICLMNQALYCLYDTKYHSVHCFMFVKLITFSLIIDGCIMKSQHSFDILQCFLKKNLRYCKNVYVGWWIYTHSDLINIDKANWVMSFVAHFDTDGWSCYAPVLIILNCPALCGQQSGHHPPALISGQLPAIRGQLLVLPPHIDNNKIRVLGWPGPQNTLTYGIPKCAPLPII